MKLVLFCRNLISHGEMDGVPLTVGNYRLEYDIELDKTTRLFTLKNLNTGLNQGFIIEKILFDGFTVSVWRDFLSFEMVDNPYVDNQLLKGENDLRFNGTMKIHIDSKKVYFNPWVEVNGWIYNQNLHSCTNDDGCYHGEKFNDMPGWNSMAPYRKDIFYNGNKKTNYLVLGCSVTYGTGLEKDKIWPALIGKKNINLSCPGFGMDAIYITLKNALQEFSFDKVIILFPTLSRRLIKIKNKDTIYSIPLVPSLDMSSPMFKNDYYGTARDDISLQVEKTKRKMVNDMDNIYSKKFLDKIAGVVGPENLFVSSWNKETYDILSNYFVNILPFFAPIDLANDNSHPGSVSHKKWADSITDLI